MPAAQSKHIIRWTRGRWRVLNLALLAQALKVASNGKVAEAIVRAALTLSHLRYGTLILVPKSINELPAGGSIDRSNLGKALRGQMRRRTLVDLLDGGHFIGALSSDGLTTVAPNGRIIDTGQILSDVRLGRGRLGGARTAAARAASKNGVVVKVSADGPISIYRDGGELYETA